MDYVTIAYRRSSQGNSAKSVPKRDNPSATCLLYLAIGCVESASYDIKPKVGSILKKTNKSSADFFFPSKTYIEKSS